MGNRLKLAVALCLLSAAGTLFVCAWSQGYAIAGEFDAAYASVQISRPYPPVQLPTSDSADAVKAFAAELSARSKPARWECFAGAVSRRTAPATPPLNYVCDDAGWRITGNTWREAIRVQVRTWLALIVMVAVVLTTLCAWAHRRRGIPPGHCPRCGYNLTGNLSGRCPECGAVAPEDVAVADKRRRATAHH